jgi:hypothetical protein
MNSEITFPLLCETCLGENPYLKMQRTPGAGTCKMCAKGCELFRWRPGRGESYKKTEVMAFSWASIMSFLIKSVLI